MPDLYLCFYISINGSRGRLTRLGLFHTVLMTGIY
jgi:hypothetical protein